jgi:hypothetical protein
VATQGEHLIAVGMAAFPIILLTLAPKKPPCALEIKSEDFTDMSLLALLIAMS